MRATGDWHFAIELGGCSSSGWIRGNSALVPPEVFDEFNLQPIVSIARKASSTNQFYSWFYEKKKIYPDRIDDWREIPVLRKQDFVDYEMETGESYHGRSSSDPSLVFRATSGTTMRPLEVPVTIDEFFEHFVDPLVIAFRHWKLNPRLFTICDSEAGFFKSMGSYGDADNLVNATGLPIDIVPIERKYDVEWLRRHWSECQPDCAFDFTGWWVDQILANGVSGEELPFKCVVGLDFPSHVADRLGRQGLKVFRLFMTSESGLIGIGLSSGRKYGLLDRALPAVLQADGDLSAIGSGLLVTTLGSSVFPWINFEVGDTVTIERGNSEDGFKRSMTYHGRTQRIPIPFAGGVFFDIGAIVRMLEHKFEHRFVLVHAPGRSPPLVGNLLLTLVESSDVSEPVPAPGLAREVREAAFQNASLPWGYTPAFVVPLGFLPREPLGGERAPILLDLARFGNLGGVYSSFQRIIERLLELPMKWKAPDVLMEDGTILPADEPPWG